MEYRLLGPVEIRHGGVPVRITAARQRAVLATLLFQTGRVVPVGALVDLLWGERPPASAILTVRNYVSRLRAILPEPVLRSQHGGYLIEAATDLSEFERLVALAHHARPAHAVTLLDQALALWRGPALADLGDVPLRDIEAPRLEEMRLAAVETRVEALIRLGEGGRLVPELLRLVAQHPLRERFAEQLMEALDACDRRSEALDVYRRTRHRLVRDLAVEPGIRLRQIHRRLLRDSVGA
ncbi:AfsR/SARP family transcriptional regulator [Actinoplanes sp. NPDC023714]|uniref:AfsR/SARP family transcriptional regulator n=1 Tax=Actinoplanes sp. NPDC023714 TaxID=3154322 RepID=UPI00340AE60A